MSTLRDHALHWLRLTVRTPPVEWIQSRVDLSLDPTSASDDYVTLDPYQVAPILAQFDPDVREVVVMAPPQTGKSFCWRLPLLYKLVFDHGPRWIIYESDDKAEDINAQQFHPLIRGIPELLDILEAEGRYSTTKRQYRFPSGPLDFCGAGSEPTSKPCRDGVADEVDTWPLTPKGTRETLRHFRDRFVTWRAKGEGCLVIVSSPTGGGTSIIGTEHRASTCEYWHLRCLGCGELSIPSHKTRLLQWETVDDHPVPLSVRLICPVCGRAHVEGEAVGMNDLGGYVATKQHAYRRGFQWGALASPRTKAWQDIAEASLEAGQNAAADVQASFDARVRGLPFRPRAIRHDARETIKARCAPGPDPANVCCCLFSADTQDDGWYWRVRAFDPQENSYGVALGFAATRDELRAAWDADYLGRPCEAGIIDEGGHRGKEVVQYATSQTGLYTYKGNSSIGSRWKPMSEHPRRLLARPKLYQAELLYLIYTHTEPDRGGYWYLEADPPETYLEHLLSMQKSKIRDGDQYENWQAVGPDHWFDCEKMMRVIWDVCQAKFQPVHWRCAVPWAARARRRPEPKQDEVGGGLIWPM